MTKKVDYAIDIIPTSPDLNTLIEGSKVRVRYSYDLEVEFQAHDKAYGSVTSETITIPSETHYFVYKTKAYTNKRANIFLNKLHTQIKEFFDKFLKSRFPLHMQITYKGIIGFDNIELTLGKSLPKTKVYPKISLTSSRSTRSISSSLIPSSSALASLPVPPSTHTSKRQRIPARQNSVATPTIASISVFAVPPAAVAIPAINPTAATITTAVNDIKMKSAKHKR